jgi:murein DD-endopeptidase MepM/ murein hydrolase activator NlpD
VMLLKIFSRWGLVVLLLVFVGACGWMDLSALTQSADNVAQAVEKVSGAVNTAAAAATTLAEETGPLQATSSSLLQTAAAGSQTEMPPALTSVARLINLAANSGAKTSLFSEPHAGYQVLPGCTYGSYECEVKAPHTGVDSVSILSTSQDLPVDILAVGPGVVMRIQFIGKGCSAAGGDCGLGNSVILEHTLADGTRVDSLYAHLDSISADLTVGQCLPGGALLGTMGRSGFGDREYNQSRYLHLEFKTVPVLGDPRTALSDPAQFREGQYFSYLTDGVDANPEDWGYRDPANFIKRLSVRDCGPQ